MKLGYENCILVIFKVCVVFVYHFRIYIVIPSNHEGSTMLF